MPVHNFLIKREEAEYLVTLVELDRDLKRGLNVHDVDDVANDLEDLLRDTAPAGFEGAGR